MKVTNLWSADRKPTVSFELFPAKTPKAAENLAQTIDVLAGLKPDFVSVTFGAGGSTRDGSRQLAAKLLQEKKLEVIAYFAGYGMGPTDIGAVLDSYEDLGVANVLVVRGDPPREQGFQAHPESVPHASDLIPLIRPCFNFCLGVAGYPEKHVEAPSKESDLYYLKLKVDLGAEFIIANYCYDNRYFFDFTARARAAGIAVPILPGIMPIYSVKMMEMLAGICGATITPEVRQGIAAVPEGDKEGLLRFGIEYATRQCEELLRAGVPGIHFYTMDRSDSVVGIMAALRAKGLV